MTKTFSKIVDESHIITYDQPDILIETNKEVSFEIRTQDNYATIDTLGVHLGVT